MVLMDEPLFYGRYHDGHDACHSSIENVAERAAAIIREYQNAVPNVVIGDGEPFPAITDQPDWQAEYKAWMKAFSAATGQNIAFLQVDIFAPTPDRSTTPAKGSLAKRKMRD
jgi:hypothetical protein